VHVVSRSRDRPPWTVISVSGDLDVVGGPDLRREIVSAVAEGNVFLILDLTAVDFIDSFGIGVVVGSIKRVRQRSGDLALVCPEPRVRRVFELCDIDRILPLHESLDQVPDPAGAPR
jgi:anti-sigma B factor antagonist